MRAAGTSQGAKEDKQDDENMTSENQATSDGQTHEKKRGRPEGMTDFQTSTEKRRASTTDVLQHKPQQTNSDFGASHDAHKDKSTPPPILDYFTTLHEHKYDPINLFEAADWLKCIANVYPVDQRSELEREVGMFCRDWLTHHQDPSQHLHMYLGDRFYKDMEKVYESEVYIQVQDLVKTFDEDTVVALKRFIDMMPRTDEVFKYEMNWEVVDKHMLHEKIRPWISNIVRSPTDEEGDSIASDILESMKEHRSASSILDRVLSFEMADVAESEMLFRKMWEMLFFKIKKLVEAGGARRVPDVAPSEQLSALKLLDFSETVDLEVEIFNGMPRTKAEVLSLEINWAVFDQHELHEKMRPWLAKEVIELFKKKKASAVDQVVDAIRKQNCPSQMLELLEPSLEDDTEFVVKTLWRTLLILVKILETDRVWNSEESREHAVGVIKRNRHYRHPSFWRKIKMQDFEMICEQNRLKSTIPRNIEELSSLEVDWAVSDKQELHNRLRPWIFGEIMEFVRPEKVATSVVDSIVSKIKDHANAKAVWELVKPSLGKRSGAFLLNLWMQLIFAIQLAGTTVGLDPFLAIGGERSDKEGEEIFQYGDRFSRNRHFMTVAFDYWNLLKLKRISEAMPKTKEELFSYDINWDVCEKHWLQKGMREGIWVETLDLIRQKQGAGLSDQIMWSIFDYHVSASRKELDSQAKAISVVEEIMSRLDKEHACPYKMMQFLEPIFGSSGSENLVVKMWYSLICGVKFAEARVEKKLPPGWGSVVLLPDKTVKTDLITGYPVLV